MKTSTLLAAIVIAALCGSAAATGKHDPKPDPSTPPTSSSSTSSAISGSSSHAGAQAGASAAGFGGSANAAGGSAAGYGGAGGNGFGGSAAGGSGGALDYRADSNFYVLPAPVSAAVLPPGMCPKGDSLSWSIGWNFFSYARSSTRSELECLEKVAEILKAHRIEPARLAPEPLVSQPPTEPAIAAPSPVPAPAPAASAAKKKRAKAVDPKRVPSCKEVCERSRST